MDEGGRSAELRYLARAVQPDLPAEPGGGAALDWDEVLRLAAWHRLGPLAYRDARRAGSGAPEAAVAALRAAHQDAGTTNVYLRHELDRVSAVLAAAEVPVMALKGMALVESCYDEIALRPMVDFDVLVPSARFDEVAPLLAEVGYGGYNGFEPGADQRTRGPFVRDDGLAALDLHGQLADDVPHLDEAGLWTRARPSARGAYLLPSPEDLVLHLAVHFVTHRGYSSEGAIGQLVDVAWMIERGLDWPALVSRALDARVAGRVHLTLVAVADVLGTPIPAEAIAQLRPAAADVDDMARRFVAVRVLSDRTWHHPEYLHRRQAASFRVGGGRLARLLPSKELLEHRFGNGDTSPSYARLYARRVRTAARPLLRGNVVADEKLHRWVRSLDT